jgi:PAS domain S-box-containing protein
MLRSHFKKMWPPYKIFSCLPSCFSCKIKITSVLQLLAMFDFLFTPPSTATLNPSKTGFSMREILRASILGLAAALGVWVIAAGGVSWLYEEAYKAQMLLVQENMRHLAQVAAAEIDPQSHLQLTLPSQQNSDLYRTTITPLLEFHAASPSVKYLYTLKPDGNGAYQFILDTAHYPEALHSKEPLEASQLGDPYTYNLDPLERQAFEKAIQAHEPFVFEQPIHDNFGTFIMAMAPFYTDEGVLSGIVGIDQSIEVFNKALEGIRKGTWTAIALVGLIALILGVIVMRIRLTALRLERLREQSDQELRDAEYNLRDMAENVPGVIFRAYYQNEDQYGFLYMSPRSDEIFGFDAGEAMESRMIPNFPPEEQTLFWSSLKESALKGQDWSLEGRIELPSGKTRWWKGLAKPKRDPKGRMVLNGVLIDISERKAFEAQLSDAKIAAEEANRAKSDFLANMSHEIRTPLNGVLGMAAILGSTQLTQEQTDCVLTIQSSSELLLSVINDVLDISKIEAGHLELESHPFHLFDAAKSLVELLRPKALEKNLTFIFEYGSDMPQSFLGDEGRIKQILLNLLGNAIKFTLEGAITLSIQGQLKDNQLWMITIAVRDTGIGIAKDKQNLVFEPFRQAHSYTTRKYGGTGLGLSICQKLTHLMNGKISLTSVPGKGSTFTIEIPLTAIYIPEKRRTTDSLSPVPTQNHTPLKILLAEDNPVNQKVASKILEKLGYAVDMVTNGEEAVQAALKTPYDLILMDIQMPVMDGLEATRQIKRQVLDSTPRIIALTAHALTEQVNECRDAGMDGHLAKPIHIAQLKEILLSTPKVNN